MIEKIGPTIYKGESIYKTGAGGGAIVSPIKFYTIGNQEENGKDKPIIGDLTNKSFDGSTFYKTVSDDIKFFNIATDTSRLYWLNGIGDERPQIGKKYYCAFKYQCTFDNSVGYRPTALSLFSRKIECGLENGISRGICLGSSDVASVIENYRLSSWGKISGLAATDYKIKYFDNSMYDDTIHNIEVILEYCPLSSVRTHRAKFFVDEQLVLDISFNGQSDAKDRDICTIGNYRHIRFADIKIIDLTTT